MMSSRAPLFSGVVLIAILVLCAGVWPACAQKEHAPAGTSAGAGLSCTVPASFLTTQRAAPRLLRAAQERAFDLYLLLCRISARDGENWFLLDYPSLARTLGYLVPERLGQYHSKETFYRSKVSLLLFPLKQTGFLSFEENVVTLTPQEGTETVTVPDEYWTYGYDRLLSFNAKYLYLIALRETARRSSGDWFRSSDELGEEYHLPATAIGLGLCELEERGILRIVRRGETPRAFSVHSARSYHLNALPDPRTVP